MILMVLIEDWKINQPPFPFLRIFYFCLVQLWENKVCLPLPVSPTHAEICTLSRAQ